MIPRFADPEDDATPLRLIEQADVQEALDALDEAERDWAITQGFSGALGEYVLIPDRSGGVVEALVGWGDAAARAKRRFAIAEFAAKAPAGAWRIESPLSEEDAEEAALGWLLSAYRFDRYKKAKAQQATLTAPEGVDPERTEAIAAAAYLARDLINTPTNDM
ncbi:MAG: M17 family peptidase N-terminal domain-containing protein, partial [Pikeienuella sp.]